MYLNHVTQYYESVVPAYEAYVESSLTNVGGKQALKGPAMQAASQLFHFRDALLPLYPKNTFTRKHVAKLCPEFDLLGDVFNATKHVDLSREGKLIQDRSSIEETLVGTGFTNPEGSYWYNQIRIIVRLLDGQSRDFLDIATNVLNFWTNHLYTEKHISENKQYRYEGDDLLTAEQVLGRQQVNIQVAGGQEFRYAVSARYYDQQSNTFKNAEVNEIDRQLVFSIG